MHSYSQSDTLLSVKFDYAHIRRTFEIYGGTYNSDNTDLNLDLFLTHSDHISSEDLECTNHMDFF